MSGLDIAFIVCAVIGLGTGAGILEEAVAKLPAATKGPSQ